jgi:hypothetical protein
MIKLAALATLFVSGAVAPFLHGSLAAKPGPKDVAQRLLRQANAGPDGRITRRVHCSELGTQGRTFSCVLLSRRSSSLGARVVVNGGALQTFWQPIQG